MMMTDENEIVENNQNDEAAPLEPEPKTFTQEQVGSMIASEREKINSRNDAKLEAQRSTFQTQFDEQNKKADSMESAFVELQKVRAEELDERTPDEKMADDLTDMRARLAARDEADEKRAKIEAQSKADGEKVQNILSTYRRSSAAIDKPDYGDAVKHLVAHRTEELTDILGFKDKDEIDKIIHEDHFALVKKAIDANEDPASVVYRYAVLNGYNPGVHNEGDRPDDRSGEKAPAHAGDKAPAHAGEKSNARDVVRMRADGQNMTDLGGGKGSGARKLTLEQYAKGTPEQKKEWARIEPNIWKRIHTEAEARPRR